MDSLTVVARDRRRGSVPIVKDISFAVNPGKVTALIGESGSGKTTIALAALGYSRAGCEITKGRVELDGSNILDLAIADRRQVRGQKVAYIAQSAASAFNAVLTINHQVCEPAVISGLLNWRAAKEKAIDLYRDLDLPEPERIGRRYPHQVSGGQLQRLMAAMAMICDPRLLILDEPTTALDVTTQIEVLRSFKKLIRRKNTSAIYVSHDLAVVAQVADEILVLKDGSIVDAGSVNAIIERPNHPYTRELIDAAHVMPEALPPARAHPARVTHARGNGEQNTEGPLVQIESVTAGYGQRQQHVALDNVSLDIYPGRTVGVIGESGSGKTTLGRIICGLMAPSAGKLRFANEPLNADIDQRTKDQLQRIQIAFQMADVALNPKHRISKILGRPLAFYFNLDAIATKKRVAELLELVELPADYANRYPRQLSGGERQRINLARALAAKPDLIICDEITSALDTGGSKSDIETIERLATKTEYCLCFHFPRPVHHRQHRRHNCRHEGRRNRRIWKYAGCHDTTTSCLYSIAA